MYKKIHIHFVGIGGIGMSGIAQVLLAQGYKITGCDLDIEQASTQSLIAKGCRIYKGNNTTLCNDTSIDVLVYSSAISVESPEIKQAQQRGISTISRAIMLAELMRTKFSIAISGSHGKTTTTSIISHILLESKLDPTVIIGGHLENISSNARLGSGDFLVAEADESDRSFLRLYPTLALVTNIDIEHLDTYTCLEDIKSTFKVFLSNLPFYGKAFVCIDDPNIQSLLPINHVNTVKYGTNLNIADLCAQEIVLERSHSTFSVYCNIKKRKLGDIYLPMPGQHNVLNCLGALSIALEIGVEFNTASQAIASFKGVDRRFSFKGSYKDAAIYDDYGHHPTEIFNTLKVAKNASSGKLIVIFQPQRYSRTQKLWNQFIEVFSKSSVDHLIITDIYPACENHIPGIESEKLVQAIKQTQTKCLTSYISGESDFYQIKLELEKLINPNDLVLFLGAGKVNKLIKDLT